MSQKSITVALKLTILTALGAVAIACGGNPKDSEVAAQSEAQERQLQPMAETDVVANDPRERVAVDDALAGREVTDGSAASENPAIDTVAQPTLEPSSPTEPIEEGSPQAPSPLPPRRDEPQLEVVEVSVDETGPTAPESTVAEPPRGRSASAEPEIDETSEAASSQPQPPERRELEERIETRLVSLPATTELEFELVDSASSEWSQLGDEVRARITRTVLSDGLFAVPSGSFLIGEVVEVRPTKRFGGRALLAVEFDSLVIGEDTIEDLGLLWQEVDGGQKKKDAKRIGGGAAAGAVLGSVAKDSDGAKVGALIGAAIGAARAAKDRGQAIELTEGAVRTIALERDLEVPVRVRTLEAR